MDMPHHLVGSVKTFSKNYLPHAGVSNSWGINYVKHCQFSGFFKNFLVVWKCETFLDQFSKKVMKQNKTSFRCFKIFFLNTLKQNNYCRMIAWLEIIVNCSVSNSKILNRLNNIAISPSKASSISSLQTQCAGKNIQ